MPRTTGKTSNWGLTLYRGTFLLHGDIVAVTAEILRSCDGLKTIGTLGNHWQGILETTFTNSKQERQISRTGRARCALSSPGRTPNRTAVAKKGDTGQPTAAPWPIESRLAPEAAEEESIIRAMRLLWERAKLLVEPSAALPLAVILDHPDQFHGRNISIILSGGNINLDALPWLIWAHTF